MMNITVAIEQLKTQLVEAVRSSIEKGFELVAGVVAGKLVKIADEAVKNSAIRAEEGRAGYGGLGVEAMISMIVGMSNRPSPISKSRASADTQPQPTRA